MLSWRLCWGDLESSSPAQKKILNPKILPFPPKQQKESPKTPRESFLPPGNPLRRFVLSAEEPGQTRRIRRSLQSPHGRMLEKSFQRILSGIFPLRIFPPPLSPPQKFPNLRNLKLLLPYGKPPRGSMGRNLE
jgi:hypothetical protein